MDTHYSCTTDIPLGDTAMILFPTGAAIAVDSMAISSRAPTHFILPPVLLATTKVPAGRCSPLYQDRNLGPPTHRGSAPQQPYKSKALLATDLVLGASSLCRAKSCMWELTRGVGVLVLQKHSISYFKYIQTPCTMGLLHDDISYFYIAIVQGG